ncbi:MAG: lysoplasmalogenase [Pseudomonadota bacterium]
MNNCDTLAPWLLRAAIIAGLSYVAIWGMGFGPTVMTIWKGAGVSLLALWAAAKAGDQDGWLLAAVMACGAAGDVLLETAGLMTGAVAFAVGHLIAIWLYARNRRASLTPSQRLLAVLIIPATVITAYVLPADRSVALGIVIYALLLSVMAAMAWTSLFPRYRTGIGAMMFVASDLLIFARLGPIGDTVTVGVAIWLLYFVGQWLIAVGVREGLAQSG